MIDFHIYIIIMEPHIEPVDLIGMVPVAAHMDRRKGEGSMVSATKLLWEENLRRAGYIPRPAEVAALASGAGKFLVEGLPGTGKTFLAEVYARITSATYIYHMCHSWSSDQEFFLGIHVPSVVRGDADNVESPGVLALVARAAENGPVVVCIDELDKAPEAVENLLLGWLQDGEVPVCPGRSIRTNMKNVTVFITSNGMRTVSDALQRRCRRLFIEPHPQDVLGEILAGSAAAGVIKMAIKVMAEVAEKDGATPSLQEMKNFLHEVEGASCVADVRQALAGWAARGSSGREFALHGKPRYLDPLWGEIRKI